MKKLDRISQLNNESNENPIDLLYKSVIGHINKSNLSEKSRGELNEKVEKTKLDFNFNKVNIVVFGDFNSGKTTFINTLIFTLLKPENNKCTIKEFDKFLPHAITENTYY